MALFGHFPYTNFHELNLDWIIKKVRELTDEWLSYNDNWNLWQNNMTSAFNELKTFVEDYFDNLDVEKEIIEEFNKLKEEGFFDEILSQLAIKKENINCNLVGSGFINYNDRRSYELNGGCYIGRNMYAIYFSAPDSDIGTLEIHDATTFLKITETQLNLKHGNSITYMPETNEIYSCGALSVSNPTSLIPDIDVVNIDDIYNPYIVRTIKPPLPSYSVGIYSLAYDQVTGYFYAICARGATPGEYNRLIKYNRELTSIENEIILNDTQPVSSQGVQVVYNNVAYLLYYNSNWRSVYTFDVNSGDIINIYSLPELINGYRYIGEVQCVFYNFDTYDWYIGARYVGSGVSGHIAYSIIECGFYKPLPKFTITNNAINQVTTRVIINVYQGRNGVSNNINTMYCIMDAINASKTANINPLIIIQGDTPKIGSCHIQGFSGAISGTSSNPVDVSGGMSIFRSSIRFTYCNFRSEVNHVYVTGETGNIAVYDSIMTVSGCTFTKRILASESILIALPATTNFNIIRSFVSCINSPSLPSGNKMISSTYLNATTIET